MAKNYENTPVEIYSGSAWQAGIVKTLLEDSEVKAYIQDEILGTLVPWNTAPGGAGAVRIFVSSNDFTLAKKIVEEYEKK
jgi:hypothetical protein